MLFWLGSIEFDTPRGRFILTASREVHGSRCRRATDDEAAQAWRFLERHLRSASYHELQPLYELYQALTSERFNGYTAEPHPSDVVHAIESALWCKQLHLEFQEPFGPLQEPEWEPPPLKPKGPPAQTPSEIWRRTETFIGIRLKDQNGDPISASRIRVKLPDGSTKEGATNDQGELEINGFTEDGSADITFLDHAKPGKAEAPEWPEEKEFKATVVDEMGNPVPHVWLWFRHGSSSNLALTDDSGVATYTTSSDVESVNVSFDNADDLADAMKPSWSKSHGTARKDWVQADDTTSTVSIFGGKIVEAIADDATAGTSQPKVTLEPFTGAESTVDNPATLSVQPLVIVVRMLGELFDTDKCFVLPEALHNVKELVKLHKEYEVCHVLIVGHTDTSGEPDYNLDLSLERTNAMMAYLTNDADAWLAWYGEDKKQSKRWGDAEDNHMIESLLGDPNNLQLDPDGNPYPLTVLGYQQWHNAKAQPLEGYEQLDEDGKIGIATRKQLILDYMHREGTTVPQGTPILVHGCGEYFPLESTGQALDAKPADGKHEQEDRRVDVYLFPRELGVLPPVPGQKAKKGEKEYLEWQGRAVDVTLRIKPSRRVRVYLTDRDKGLLLPGAICRVVGGALDGLQLTAGSSGDVVFDNLDLTLRSLVLEWSHPAFPDEFVYSREVALDVDSIDDASQRATRILKNLGYCSDTSLDIALKTFQNDYGVDKDPEPIGLQNGQVPPDTVSRLEEIEVDPNRARKA